MDRRYRPTLRILCGSNRGGLQIPRLIELDDLYNVHYSIFEGLRNVFQHGWQLRLLFSNESRTSVYPAAPLLYMIVNSLWKANLQYLSDDIKRISFREIRRPDPSINETLHDRREDLAHIKSGLIETTTYVETSVNDYFKNSPFYADFRGPVAKGTPVVALGQILADVIELEAFLMETFQLLMSSISVQEAQLSSRQALASSQQGLRATQLTLLASIYVPLSFVTGIFGMNLKELNGSTLSIWVCIVAMMIAAIVTGLLFWALDERSQRKNGKRKSDDLNKSGKK